MHRGTNPRLSIRSVFSEGKVIRARGLFTDHGKNLGPADRRRERRVPQGNGLAADLPVSKGTARWTFVLDRFG